MGGDRLLHIYLEDHYAGSLAGRELAKRSASSNEGNEFGTFLQRLVREIEEDRAALEKVIEAVEGHKDNLKQGAAWLAEKVGRLKLNGQLIGYSDLSRLVELEGLAVGVEAKLGLWRSLRQRASGDARLDVSELDLLIERSETQRKDIESFRLRAASIAFGAGAGNENGV